MIALLIFLRLYALGSDAYPRLSWSSALLTDEGFYIHNARNVILFGKMRTDGFNNVLIMPLLHLLQLGWFRLWGVGAIQARLLSVVLSLLTLLLFFGSLRRVFGLRVALVATLFLGLDHVNLLYNRLALMDTPASFWMVAAFAAFTRIASGEEASLFPAFACGGLLVAAYTTRGLALFLFPVPFVLLLWKVLRTEGEARRLWWRRLGALTVGLGGALAFYLFAWYLPNRAEMGRVNRYYLTHQLVPHSLDGLRQNMVHALLGDHRGMSPYLFRHTPIMFALVLLLLCAWLVSWLAPRKKVAEIKAIALDPAQELAAGFLLLWLLLAWGLYGGISYSPPRYYVLFYPAFAALASLALVHLETVLKVVRESRPVRTLLGSFLVFHFGEMLLHHVSRTTEFLLYGSTLVGAACLWFREPGRPALRGGRQSGLSAPAALAIAFWTVINTVWLADWLLHLRFAQREADRWLALNLPADTILIGDVAPGLCLDNRFPVVSVIGGLCNDVQPVEHSAPAPRAILILDGRMKERWWLAHYPSLVTPIHRTVLFPRIVRFPVGVYYLKGVGGQSSAVKRTLTPHL